MFSNAGSVRSFLDRKGKDGRSASPSCVEEAPSSSDHREMSNYTTGTSSTFERNITPVPTWPLPPLTAKPAHKPIPLTLHKIKEVRPSASKASLSGRDAQPRSPAPATSYHPSPDGRFPATPPLPPKWTVVHDRAICVLDACDYSLTSMIKKMRSAFPELAGSVLTPVMVDKRLRTLDQNVDVDFFRIGLEHLLLTGDDEHKPVQTPKVENKKAVAADRRYTAPSMPSFSSISSSKQNSGLDLSEPSRDQPKVRGASAHLHAEADQIRRALSRTNPCLNRTHRGFPGPQRV